MKQYNHIKKIITLMLTALCSFALLGCTNIPASKQTVKQEPKNNTLTATPISYKEKEVITPTENKPIKNNIITANLKIGDKDFVLKLYNNSSVQALIKKMPLTIDMKDLNKNEKYNYFIKDLPSNAESVKNIKTGDFMLYGSDCLVLFYKDFQTSYNYTKLGYIEDTSKLAEILGSGNIQIVLSIID
ncbi:cyclophilin-like fold protein [Clostridioides sp. ES-S-0005-03]|uniref:cyclophilin-like fold protein n=1 Tax=Clostridioides sp. ES-S-0005-03 TaxID=2770774 RepID=UPI001D128E08